MYYRVPEQIDIADLIKCPDNRRDLFDFYKNYGATREKFEFVLRHIELGNLVYYKREYFSFYDESGKLLSKENADWGD